MESDGAASMRFYHVLITGPPGIGKTTVCKKVVALIEKKGLSCDGFFTEEIHSLSKKRIGFDVVPVKCPERRLPLARVTLPSLTKFGIPDFPWSKPAGATRNKTKFHVGKYSVLVNNFEQVALSVFPTNSDILQVDEIGKMELFSKSFADKVSRLVFSEKKKSKRMLTTIPEVAPAHLVLIQKLRSNSRCKIFEVRYQNQDNLPDEICKMICQIIKDK